MFPHRFGLGNSSLPELLTVFSADCVEPATCWVVLLLVDYKLSGCIAASMIDYKLGSCIAASMIGYKLGSCIVASVFFPFLS